MCWTLIWSGENEKHRFQGVGRSYAKRLAAAGVILRKGGIAEGKDGFAFRHREFFLFPTFFHEQVGRIRGDSTEIPEPNESQVVLRFFAKVEHALMIESWTAAAALAPFHILQESVVRERFEDERAGGIHVAFVRVFRIEPEWILPNEKIVWRLSLMGAVTGCTGYAAISTGRRRHCT
jgi:hypothetical protein